MVVLKFEKFKRFVRTADHGWVAHPTIQLRVTVKISIKLRKMPQVSSSTLANQNRRKQHSEPNRT